LNFSDANGILSVNTREESTGRSKNIKIKNEKGRLNKSEIDRMIADAEKFREEDEKQKVRVSARNGLESYLFSMRAAFKEYGDLLTELEYKEIGELITINILWLEENQEAPAIVYDEKLKYLQQIIVPIMNRLHKKSPDNRDSPKIEEVN
jgi:heat shock 70kDa protein 1/2/6/8